MKHNRQWMKEWGLREAWTKLGNQNSANRKHSFIVPFNYIEFCRIPLDSISISKKKYHEIANEKHSVSICTLKMLYCCRIWFRWLCVSCWIPIKPTSLSPGKKNKCQSDRIEKRNKLMRRNLSNDNGQVVTSNIYTYKYTQKPYKNSLLFI